MAQIGRVTGFHKKTHVSEKDLLDDLGKESSGASPKNYNLELYLSKPFMHTSKDLQKRQQVLDTS
jgi:hypothetical protein